VVGVASGICSAAIWFSMAGLQKSLGDNKQDIKDANKEISGIKQSMTHCRKECDDSHASKEDYLREAGYTRRFQELQIAAMAKIEAKLDVMQQLPEIAGQIARSVIAEMKRGE
jgi:septal ring factor EnvC (AmiA/AmiB activator)